MKGVSKKQREKNLSINGKYFMRKYYDINKLGNLLEEVIQNLGLG